MHCQVPDPAGRSSSPNGNPFEFDDLEPWKECPRTRRALQPIPPWFWTPRGQLHHPAVRTLHFHTTTNSSSNPQVRPPPFRARRPGRAILSTESTPAFANVCCWRLGIVNKHGVRRIDQLTSTLSGRRRPSPLGLEPVTPRPSGSHLGANGHRFPPQLETLRGNLLQPSATGVHFSFRLGIDRTNRG